MALEATDLFIIQRPSEDPAPLLKTTASQVDAYISKTLDEVTLKGNNSNQDITLGTDKIVLNASTGGAVFTDSITLPGGGSDTQALQKQEVTALIAAIPLPDLTSRVAKAGDTMTGQLTLPGGGSDTQALQKQEVESLISAIPLPDLTSRVAKAGDTMTGQLTLPGGGSDTQALQKQEVTALISAIPLPDLTSRVAKAGDNMTGDLTLGTNKITLNATNGSATFSSTLNVTGGLGTIFTADNSGFASTVLSRWISNINSPGGTVCSINGDGSFNSSGSASFAGALEAASIDGGTY